MATPGELFDDRYEVKERLGEGGMGSVYRAFDRRLAREVALKVLRAGAEEGSSGPARLLREARAAAALNHANAVAVFDVGEHDGAPYLAMELIEGHSLRRYVGDLRITLPQRLRWLVDVGRALAAAHARGLVHRDIKPENVMIREDGVVKVLDFGIARRIASPPVEAITEEGRVVGTPLYMAPEQLRGDVLDERVDQFAWGAVAYEMLTGVKPWSDAGRSYRTIAQILGERPLPPSSRSKEVPSAVDAVVMRALEKDPAARFPTMDLLLDALSVEVPTGSRNASRGLPEPRSPSVSPQARSVESLTDRAGAASVPVERRAPARAGGWLGLGLVVVLVGGALAVTFVASGGDGARTAVDPSGIAVAPPSAVPSAPPPSSAVTVALSTAGVPREAPASPSASGAPIAPSSVPSARPTASAPVRKANAGRVAVVKGAVGNDSVAASDLIAAVRQAGSVINACFAASELDPEDHRLTRYGLQIDAQGLVSAVVPDGSNPKLDRCMGRALRTLRVAPITGPGGPVSIFLDSEPR